MSHFFLQCFESTTLCLQGQVIEMVGIQTLVQTAHDLFLACNVDSNKITVTGYWQTVELFRNEVKAMFQSFAGQTFTRHTTTSFQSALKSTSTKHSSNITLPTMMTTHKIASATAGSRLATTTTDITSSISHLLASPKVSTLATTAVTSSVPVSILQTRTNADTTTSHLGRNLAGMQMFPIEVEMVRVTSPEATSTTIAASLSTFTSPSLFTSLPTAFTTSSSVSSPPSQAAVPDRSSLERSDVLKSPVTVKSKVDAIELPTGQTITLKQGDIVLEAVDVIVNAANSFLKHEGGVAKMIDSASDGLVQLFSDELVARDGVVPVGGAKYTQAGGQLKCKYVVHTVGPDARKHNPKECETLLRLACENSLTLAEALKATSVAFPAVSAGIFAVDVNSVARNIIKTLVEFKYSSSQCLKDILIVINDSETLDAFKAYFAKKRKSLGKHRHSSRPKSTPMVGNHQATAQAPQVSKSSYLPPSTTLPSYTFPTSKHRRTGSLDHDLFKGRGAAGYTNHDQHT